MKILLLLLLFPSFALCTQNPVPPEALLGYTDGSYTLQDFRFRSGEVLPKLRLAYATVGTPVRDVSGQIRNAVLLLHGTANSRRAFLDPAVSNVLFGPGQPLDLHKYYVIIPDSLGHGKSSKPSDGLRAKFPKYDYEDMVVAQYRLLTEGLRIPHLRLILGVSMGGMQTWLWGERYPTAMDGLMPLGCYPVEIAGWNRLWRRILVDAIRSDPAWESGNYEKPPRAALATVIGIEELVLTTPSRLQTQYPTRASLDSSLDHAIEEAPKYGDLNDQLFAFLASSDYNPQPVLEKIVAKLLAINVADDEINPPQLQIFEREMPRVRNGRYVVIPPTTYGHSTYGRPEFWQAYLKEFLDSLSPPVNR
jgi:homoserine O-acetyltransferase/O-succinyltransferase